MKKVIFSFLFVTLMCIGFLACDKHESIIFTDLPSESQAFIQKYFPNVLVNEVEKYKEEPLYEVKLNNGFELSFYGDGRWQEIDGNRAILPATLIQDVLPQGILDYLAREYTNVGVTAVERSSAGYNIELSMTPTITLYFDPSGDVLIDWEQD